MIFEAGEFTVETLIDYLNKKYGGKIIKDKRRKRLFNENDIKAYLNIGHLPYKYGGNELKRTKNKGLSIVVLGKSLINDDQHKEIKTE